MGGLKTYVTGALMALCPLAPGVGAMPSGATEQAQVFAGCLGRFSAIMEHEWLLGRDGEDARAERGMFEALLDAVVPDARAQGLDGAQILHLRIEAKHAQARLLQVATFQTDERRRRHATLTAERQVSMCRALVVG